MDSDCLPGHEGPLCSICSYNSNFTTYKISKGFCAECPAFFLNIIVIFGMIFVSVIFLLILIRFFYYFNTLKKLFFWRNYQKNAQENVSLTRKNSIISKINVKDPRFFGVCIKILLNYMQMISIISAFNLKWPSFARVFFLMQSGVGNISTNFFSFDCFTKGNFIFYLC